MLAQSGTPFAIDYTAYDGATGLFVAAKVYDITGAPALVSTLAMAHVALGAYTVKFTGVSGKVYAIVSMVYTDIGHTIPDPDRSPSTEVVQCIDFQTFASVFGVIAPKAKFECDEICNNDCDGAVNIFQGDDVNQLFQLFFNNDPLDLSTATEIEIDIQNEPEQTQAFFAAKLTNGGIVVQDATLGKARLVLGAATTMHFLPIVRDNIDIIVTKDGKKQTYRIPKSLTVLEKNS